MVYLVIILFHLVAVGKYNSIERALKMHMAKDFFEMLFLSLRKVGVEVADKVVNFGLYLH